MLRKIRHLQNKQNKDLGDRISIKIAHNLSALPGWGAIPSYQDESETIKAATAGENDYEFWVTQINSSNIEIIFEGSIKVDHKLEKDTYYYLSSKKPGRISLTQAYPHQAPCLYVLDKQNLRLLEARDTLSIGNTEVFSEKLSQIEAKVADLEDHKDSDLTEDVEAIASQMNSLEDTLHKRIDLLTESFNNQSTAIDPERIVQGNLEKTIYLLTELNNSNSERLVSVEEKIEDIISINKNTVDNLKIMNDRFASFDKLEQSIEQLQQSNYSTEVLIQEPTARYIDLRLADYSKFPTNQSDISKPTLIQGKIFRGERSPTKGMVLSRIDGKANNQELFVFEGFRGSSSQTFEAIFSFTTKADKYNIKGFWGLGGLNYNTDFTNAHKEYFAIADYFSNGTFQGAYGINNYRVNHGNLTLTPDRDWCKLSFIAGGTSARIVKLDPAILDEVDPRRLFDSKWETKSEVNWSSTIALPTELIGAIALRETTNSALNILAVALR